MTLTPMALAGLDGGEPDDGEHVGGEGAGLPLGSGQTPAHPCVVGEDGLQGVGHALVGGADGGDSGTICRLPAAVVMDDSGGMISAAKRCAITSFITRRNMVLFGCSEALKMDCKTENCKTRFAFL